MAIGTLLVAKVAFIDPLKADFSLIAAPDTINFGLLVAGPACREHLCFGGGLGAVVAPFPRV